MLPFGRRPRVGDHFDFLDKTINVKVGLGRKILYVSRLIDVRFGVLPPAIALLLSGS